jgi:hypothetical protein
MGANRYPAHVRTLGCYAWKPLLLHELRQEFPHAAGVVWLDTAVGFHGPSPQTVRHRARARVNTFSGDTKRRVQVSASSS